MAGKIKESKEKELILSNAIGEKILALENRLADAESDFQNEKQQYLSQLESLKLVIWEKESYIKELENRVDTMKIKNEGLVSASDANKEDTIKIIQEFDTKQKELESKRETSYFKIR